MTSLRRGDVVLVPFDFTNRSGSKWRPAVVVSNDSYNRSTPDILLASITGNLNALPHPGDHVIAEWQVPGLLPTALPRGPALGSVASAITRAAAVMVVAMASTARTLSSRAVCVIHRSRNLSARFEPAMGSKRGRPCR